ncbi:YraN family protein [Propionicimonas sp.]|uniref:YraN family protein n=1 Tax=Propionicimonas sp. TaxID=1955623 RepID=UPI0017EA2B25|nr:YraN family protein [Propionicimonas sp.]MBU3976225.1 YraN family protein [Actinomycetota bacterium]MBA3021037.1 YraN family protein [Propionicimonas sp.]MBU3985620.1 YraN family protein [Actinomycetota bacterium]MBU4008405.1 YraN family protein [Actinomycetota bacterium]MBU4066445.1 YraN family protein [Actinomycetota bacterium]
MDKAQVWHAGEDVAAEHLAGLGWRIVERNWRCRAGELDIIAIEPGPEPVVVFCEVKTRRGTAFGQPVEAITRAKLAKLRELSLLWLRAAGHTGANLRIDAIGVLLSQHGPALVDHRRGIC